MLRIVVTKVVKDTRSGLVLNCKASIVVFAAAGIADCKIKTDLTIAGKGKNNNIPVAMTGEATIRIAEVAAIAL